MKIQTLINLLFVALVGGLVTHAVIHKEKDAPTVPAFYYDNAK